MTKRQIYDACTKYDHFLDDMDAVPKRENHVCGSLNHARWMLDQIITFLCEDKIEKAHRWLGFVQGVLWCETQYTIDEMKNDNR